MTNTDDVTHLRALLADATARAEKAEAERDTALAACAEMRAAIDAFIDGTECLCCGGFPWCLHDQDKRHDLSDALKAALSRTDLGAGWASPEVVAQMVGALQMVESDGEFDSLHEVTRKFVVDVLALLGKGKP